MCETTMLNIIREQYHLAKHANISVSDSELLPDFEREAHINFIQYDIRKRNEQIKNQTEPT